jgi:hypothetical protein
MRSVKRLAPFLLVASVVGCSAVTIQTDFDPAASGTISEYRTYAWLPHPSGGDTRVNNPLVASRVETAVDQVLSSKGYSKTTAASASFLVGYHAALDGKVDIETMNRYYGYGYARWYGSGALITQDYVREYEEGTLIMDIVDKTSNELVWRGSAQAEVNMDVTPAERQERITNAVQLIFEEFPPN